MNAISMLEHLRAIGVKSAKMEGSADGTFYCTDVEFFPHTERLDASPSVPKYLDLGAPEKCACEHYELEHNAEGYCTAGCSPEQCNPKAAAQ